MARHPQSKAARDARPSGIPGVSALRWGAHVSCFCRDGDDLLDVVVPFFLAGLEANERCVWISHDRSGADVAGLAARIPCLEERITIGQVLILRYDSTQRWSHGGCPEDLAREWLRLKREALDAGYEGLRIGGDPLFLRWAGPAARDQVVAGRLQGRRILALCSYDLEGCTIDDALHLLRHHDVALVRREGRWEPVQGASQLLAAGGSRPQPAGPSCSEAARSWFGSGGTLRALDVPIAEGEVGGRAVLGADERLLRLQRVIAALSEASSLEEVAQITAGEVRDLLDADGTVVAVPAEDGSALRLHGQPGLGEAPLLSLHEDLPLVRTWKRGEPCWLLSRSEVVAAFPELPEPLQAVVCLPLQVASRRIGVLGVGFVTPRALAFADLALVHDIARQAAVALEGACLFDQVRLERQRAEQASRARDDFLARLGHELRNPLAPMVTALHLMDLRGDDVFARERTILQRQVQHMVRLVDDLLDVSRITRGDIELRPARIALEQVLADAVELASPLLEERAHRLEIDAPTHLMLVADRPRLAQAVGNLLINAARFTPEGGRIRVQGREERDQLVLEVVDSGQGIAPDLLPDLFDLFVQVPQALDRSQGGLGLGLSIVRALVQLHGGTIRASSEGPGRGSTFTMRLPIGAAGLSEPTSQAAAREGPGRMRRVLLVDDNRDAADTLADALCAMGYDVRAAYDGPQALELVSRFQPSLALLDIGLPGMDGYELAQHLRQRLNGNPPVLVALTGYGCPSDRERSQRAGFHAHLVKPISLETLQGLVDALAG